MRIRFPRLRARSRQPELVCQPLGTLHPALPEAADVLGRTDAHVLAHAEGLQAIQGF